MVIEKHENNNYGTDNMGIGMGMGIQDYDLVNHQLHVMLSITITETPFSKAL